MKYIDLHNEIAKCKTETNSERLEELSNNLPKVAICSIGGFPIQSYSKGSLCWNFWNGKSTNNIKTSILEALGASASLTYTNRRELSLEQLGTKCLELNHLWGYNWINITLVFAKYPLRVQMAFARDSRFFLGWTVEPNNSEKVFTVTGSFKDWKRYLDHRDDNSFDSDTREAMTEAWKLLEEFYTV